MKSSVSYPEFEDITPTTSTDGTEEDEDDDYDEDDDDYDDGMGPDSGHDSEPLNRKIGHSSIYLYIVLVCSVESIYFHGYSIPQIQNFNERNNLYIKCFSLWQSMENFILSILKLITSRDRISYKILMKKSF